MKLKNIIKLKEGYRVGFDTTEEDFYISESIWGVRNKYYRLNNFTLAHRIVDKLQEDYGYSDIEVDVNEVKGDVFGGYAYFDIQPKGTYINSIKEKYNIH